MFRLIEIETHFLDGCTVFTDLSADPTLFMGQGDYQFEVYRLMQKRMGEFISMQYLTAAKVCGHNFVRDQSHTESSVNHHFTSWIKVTFQLSLWSSKCVF